MRAVVFAGKGEVQLDDRPKPTIQGESDALLRVTAAGICGTDLHLIEGKLPGMTVGTVIGHEFVGVIEDLGSAVRSVKQGARVVASMQTACGGCRPCSRQDYRNCASFALFGLGKAFGSLPGGQAEYVRVPLADMTLAAIPETISDETAVLMSDILPTAYTAMVRAGVRPGDTVAIVGAGPVGQLAVMCAQLFGASQVFAVDLVAARLKEAEALGAIPVDASQVNPAEFVADHTNSQGADIVVEAVGSQSALDTTWSLGRPGAVMALVGLLVDEQWPITAGANYLGGIDVRPIIGDSLTHRWDLMRLAASGRVDAGTIISHVLPLGDAVHAYEMFTAKEATKIVLRP